MTSRSYGRALGRVRDLDAARWIFWGNDLAQLGEQRWLDVHVGEDPVLPTSHFQSQIAAARAGLGVALLPEPYAVPHDLMIVQPARSMGRFLPSLLGLDRASGPEFVITSIPGRPKVGPKCKCPVSPS